MTKKEYKHTNVGGNFVPDTANMTISLNEAVQTVHIPYYAKDANDSVATEATEIHRTWLSTSSLIAPFHPDSTKANNLIPKFGLSRQYGPDGLGGRAGLSA